MTTSQGTKGTRSCQPFSTVCLCVLPITALLFLHDMWSTAQQEYHMHEGNKRYFEWTPSSSSDTIKQTQINKMDRVARRQGFQNSYTAEAQETRSCQKQKPECVLNLHFHSRPVVFLEIWHTQRVIQENYQRYKSPSSIPENSILDACTTALSKDTSSSPFFLEDEH